MTGSPSHFSKLSLDAQVVGQPFSADQLQGRLVLLVQPVRFKDRNVIGCEDHFAPSSSAFSAS